MQGPRQPRRQLLVEPLEHRSLPAATVSSFVRSGVLSVVGSESADIIVVRQTGAGAVTLDANGTRQLYRGVSRVIVDGRGGDDRIYLDTRISDAARIAPIPAQLQGSAGNDLLVGGSGADQFSGGDGSDSIYGDRGADWIDGGNGADRLYGNDGDDVIAGGAGDDLLAGGAGTDYLDAGVGNDWLYGGGGTDTLVGGTGDDYFEGGAANDKLYGGDGNDWLTGGAGDDLVYGGAGKDYLEGGPGNDSLLGGEGFDSYFKDFGDALTADQSEATDIHQGSSGTCVVLASLSAVADSGTDLSQRIVKTGDNQYAVPLYRPGAGWVYQTVYFDGVWTDNDPMLSRAGDAWVLIYQRAFLQEMGVRWNDPDQSAWASRYGDKYQRADAALVAITGAAIWHGAPTSGLTSADLSDLTASVAGSRPTIVLTRPGELSGYGLIDDHAYTVLSVQRNANGLTTVTLRNPWGADGPVRQGADDGVITISWDVFRTTMMGFCVA